MTREEEQVAQTLVLATMALAVASTLRTKAPLTLRCGCGDSIIYTLPQHAPQRPDLIRAGEAEHAGPSCVTWMSNARRTVAEALLRRLEALADSVEDRDLKAIACAASKQVPALFGD